MRIPETAKAITAANEDGQGHDLVLLKVTKGVQPYYDNGIRAQSVIYPAHSRITLGDHHRYDYYAFYLGDDSENMLPSYFAVEY